MITFKDSSGSWAARQEIVLDDKHVLVVYTARRATGLVTTIATINQLQGNFLISTRYSKETASSGARCTETLVKALCAVSEEVVKAALQHIKGG